MASQLTKGSSCDSGLPRAESEDRDSTKIWLEGILEEYHTSAGSDHLPTIEVDEWSINPVKSEVLCEPRDETSSPETEAGGKLSSSFAAESSLMELLAISVQYKVCGNQTSLQMIAKVPPQDAMTRVLIRELALDKREIRFYTEVVQLLEPILSGLPIPICYHASHKEGADSILVLEDLNSRNFNRVSLTNGLTLTEATAALRSLAKIHAASVVYSKKHKIDLRKKFPYLLSQGEALSCFQSLVGRGLPLLIKFLQNKRDYVDVRKRLQNYLSDNKITTVIEDAFIPSVKLNCLVHCDFWVNNLLFRKEDEQTLCFIIDWQLMTYGSPAIDIALLFTTSLPADVRRDYRRTLLTTYWTELNFYLSDLGCADAIKNCDVLDLEKDMKKAEAMAALVMVGSVDLALGNQKREERVLSTLTDYFENGIL